MSGIDSAQVPAGHDRPLRVCIVAPSLDILGGQAVQASRLLARLQEVPGLEVSLLPVNPRLPGSLRHLQKIKYLRTVLTESVYLASLLLRLHKYDVVHAFSASYFSFVLAPTPAILLSKLFGKKVVLNYRSGEAEDHLQRWGRTAIPTVRLVDRVVVPSGYLVDVFSRFGLRAQSIFNIVDLDRFRFRQREPLRPVFFANRNLEPLYNVACILRAFSRIQHRYPDAQLIVAGDGSQRNALESLAAELDLRNVEFLGRVAPEQMNRLYDAADIYLNSSNIDNMPASIIEAFASGLPVVTTNAGGIPYIVENEQTGLLVDCDDHVALADAALRLLGDPGLASGIVQRAHAQCHSSYTWTAVRDEWLKLYTALASARHAGEGDPAETAAATHVTVGG
jgi:glycosyltransferase involved in cell wall biosynthesis